MLIKNCAVLTFFCDGFVLFQKVGLNTINIPRARNVLKPRQYSMFLSMQTHVLESSLLTQRKEQQMDSLLEELF
jgi:hypothetical protein